MIYEILIFCFFRFIAYKVIKNDNVKGYPLYTYYVSILYQLFILPIYYILYKKDIISASKIFYITII